MAQPDPAPGAPGRELEPGEQVDGAQARRSEPGDVAHHDAGPGRPQQRPDLVAQPPHLVPGDGAGQHEYSGCHGVHDR
ncbi:hypothetical protein AQI94_09800 [Streptomyces pseudovenezuelae]|uniref:Uncharacterized protein n=1 Tax=Streptomyces pseudovenezuelae TaxID=67350 RepID=A0A117PS58_9ACTN|nr:hypothetical protein AQI94_09800 [Streptomyces pseudovenezuelae]